MTPSEYPSFCESLLQLADALGARAPTQAGVKVWIQTLKEFAFPDIVTALDGWAKRSTKMPAPADLWKVLNEQRAEKLEANAAAEKRVFEHESVRTFQRNDRLGRELRKLAAGLKDAAGSDPKEWAHVLWNRFALDWRDAHGNAISEVQLRTACTALGRSREQALEARGNVRAGVGA